MIEPLLGDGLMGLLVFGLSRGWRIWPMNHGDGGMLLQRLLMFEVACCCSGAVGWIVVGMGLIFWMGCRCRDGGGQVFSKDTAGRGCCR